jgi:hypothetical protein
MTKPSDRDLAEELRAREHHIHRLEIAIDRLYHRFGKGLGKAAFDEIGYLPRAARPSAPETPPADAQSSSACSIDSQIEQAFEALLAGVVNAARCRELASASAGLDGLLKLQQFSRAAPVQRSLTPEQRRRLIELIHVGLLTPQMMVDILDGAPIAELLSITKVRGTWEPR